MYEISKSPGWGSHIPKNSTSNAVRDVNPMSNDPSETFMSVVELPYEYTRRGRHHEIRNLASDIKATGCSMIIVAEGFSTSKLCDPYVLLYGKKYENVDRAVAMVEDMIRRVLRSVFFMSAVE